METAPVTKLPMKILIVQLARLGDLALTWPTLRALKRSNPEAEVHLLVRHRFAEMAELMPEAFRVHYLNSADLLASLEINGAASSVKSAKSFFKNIKSIGFDRVINLSFSPMSSYVTHLVSNPESEISGYTRYEDGSFCLSDHTSAYFFAQVGEYNRFHLGDLFSATASVNLKFEDWLVRTPAQINTGLPPSIVIHLGASQIEKRYPIEYWSQVVEKIIPQYNGVVYLIGSNSERRLANEIERTVFSSRLISLVGETDLEDLFELIANAELFVGADSGPLHLASLCGTPAINLSVGPVRFWETGPKSADSRILVSKDPRSLSPTAVIEEIDSFFGGKESKNNSIEVTSPLDEYKTKEEPTYQERLIRFLYIGDSAPKIPDAAVQESLLQLADLYEVCVQQCQALMDDSKNRIAAGIIQRCEQTIQTIGETNEKVRPLVAWFTTEKSRIHDGPVHQVILKTKEKYFMLGQVLIELLKQNNRTKEAPNARK